jgi:hypothetical protein
MEVPMRRFLLVAAIAAVLALLAAPAGSAPVQKHRAILSGDEEVPAVDTRARGQATFRVNADATALSYRLLVANIDGVTQAHLHCGAAGVNGPVVAFLFGPDVDGTTVNGVLAAGTLTAADVIPRPDSPACPGGVANFHEMLDRIESGEVYVNVHTLEWSGGEIRGQL